MSGRFPGLPARMNWMAPQAHHAGYSFPIVARLPTHIAIRVNGSPRFPTDLSTRAVLNHPGKPDDCFYPLRHRQ
jgi:hypothetical protein